MRNLGIHKIVLVPEKSRPRMPRCRISILLLQFEPVIKIWIMHLHISTHLRQFAKNDFRSAVTRVAYILPVACAAKKYRRTCQLFAHISKASLVRLATCRPRVSLISIAMVVILKISSSKPRICLYAHWPSPPSFGRQYPPMPGPGKIILLCVGLILIALITLIKSTPFRSANKLHSSRKARIVALIRILNNLRRFRFDRPIHNRQREFFVFKTSCRNLSTRLFRFFVASRAYPPEIPYRRYIVFAWHNPLETVRKKWLRLYASFTNAFFMIGQATNSVVPGATVVSIKARQSGL